jgi:uncharacterized protein (TIGR00299 family) protein
VQGRERVLASLTAAQTASDASAVREIPTGKHEHADLRSVRRHQRGHDPCGTLDLGLSEEWLRDFVRDLGIGSVDVHIERVNRRGISAPHIRFSYPPEHAHRHLRHVVEIIDRCNTTELARTRAREAFRRIAEAEAKVHGTTIEKVHFHEVGATDAILDIVCVMAAVEQLGFAAFRTRPVALGSGWVDIAHGRYPVPAPATLDILSGLPLTGADLPGECTTPSGAAILATLTEGRRPGDHFTIERTGFGAGTRDPEHLPNVLRVIISAMPLVRSRSGSSRPTSTIWRPNTSRRRRLRCSRRARWTPCFSRSA